MSERFVGIDVGAETLKAVELVGGVPTRTARIEHHKDPEGALARLLADWSWDGVAGAAATGRLARRLALPRVPAKQAQATGFRRLFGPGPATVVTVGSHGFSVLELRGSGLEIHRENARCSQGTGNFLRQLVERFGMSVEEASEACADVSEPAALSGRCPVILKTDMTHLANKGEDRARILAGLYDAVCENVQVLIKPRTSPPRVLLAGGVSRSRRIRRTMARFLERHAMVLLEGDELATLHLDALGCALLAAEAGPVAVPSLDGLLLPDGTSRLEHLPPLSAGLGRVRRLRAAPPAPGDDAAPVWLGFDIGSTGSKAVALETGTRRVVWRDYLQTAGRPVEASQALMRRFAESPTGARPVAGFGATGSGREIVGSLLATCYGAERVHVINEIAAHAEGALHHDPRVDTIFEIGGQDAKYIRLADGRVVDAAMNEACSAGTGSFIEEQGRRFAGIRDVVQLGEVALGSPGGVSLGQHCSVFMAEIIDEAVAAGVPRDPIVAGIYDAIVQNYLNRVKGSRSVGQVIFCQGMPFSADALAAAVALRTGSEVVVPPEPGIVGALGIALLAERALEPAPGRLDPGRLLEARIARKDTFVCRSTRGCGGGGNRCRIDRLHTRVAQRDQRFTWGGGCSLWDRGTGRRKLPDLTPDPFRDRERLVDALVERLAVRRGGECVAITDEFALKGLFPFFAAFVHALGFDLEVHRHAGPALLKRGIEQANVPFCAPMQLHHGMAAAMADSRPDHLLLPMIRSLPREGEARRSVSCPIVQAAPDLLRWDLDPRLQPHLVTPTIDMGPEGLSSQAFLDSCLRLARALGVGGAAWLAAWRTAREAQEAFDAACVEAGRRALDFCDEHDLIPVGVLGRPYTVHQSVLNSNVPALLREQGAVGIPVDCLPVGAAAPTFQDVYWGYGQRNLRAAWELRRRPGTYALWASNYSCGPDSFNLHFFAALMQGRPYAVIETDGHSGDAGTKTRIEAFLHCAREDRAARHAAAAPQPDLRADRVGLADLRRRGERLLVPRMGPGSETIVACLKGAGVDAEVLPMPGPDEVRLGRRHTSGKECLPLILTAGSLLRRLELEADPERRFAFFMPTAGGPCRFGVYNLLHGLLLERLAMRDRVRIWSPPHRNYFEGTPPGFAALVFSGIVAGDLLLAGLYDARPVEREAGAAQAVYGRFFDALLLQLEAAAAELSGPGALLQVTAGELFGMPLLLRRAAAAFAAVKTEGERPTVLVVGEIYVRCDPFANDFVVEQLEARGLRVRFAPASEWFEYVGWLNRSEGGFGARLSNLVQRRILDRLHAEMTGPLGWPRRTDVPGTIEAAVPWVRPELHGEAVLTVGGPVHEWREGLVDGVVNVGPLECMPTKIAEAQLFHVAENEGLASLTLPLNGDPVDPQVLDTFAYEVRARYAARRTVAGDPPGGVLPAA